MLRSAYVYRMQNHRDVINLWPTQADLARDLGIDGSIVRMWTKAGKIPPKRYDEVTAAAKRRGFPGVTYAFLSSTRPKKDTPHGGQGRQ